MKQSRFVMLLILAIVFTVAIVALVACDNGNQPVTPTEKEFTGITFSNSTVVYDGQEHAITVQGTLPEGANVAYEGNTGTNVGTYNAKATITCEGYKTLELTATLTISKANYDMSAVSWDYTQAFNYDGTAKTVTLKGNLPEGVTVKEYTNNTQTDTGTYNAKVTFNYDETNHNAPGIADCVWTIQGSDFTGLSIEDLTVDYDGNEHVINVNGTLPAGANVAYENNKATNAGVYNVKATITCKGYNTLTLTATLTVNKINYDMSAVAWDYTQAFTYDGEAKTVTLIGLPTGVTVKSYTDNAKTDAGSYTASVALNYDSVNYNAPQVPNCEWTINKATINAELSMSDSTVEYDGLPHSIQVIGNVPAGVTATYYYNNVETDEVTAVGDYTVRCVIGNKNYESIELTATLKIKATEKQLYSVVTANGSIYFQNDLDGEKLYKVNGNSVAKINNDVPNYMIANGNNIYYYSTSLFSKVIKNYDGTTAAQLYSTKGEYLTTDGTYIYYAINNLVFNTDLNGIYRIKLDDSTAEPTRLTTDKAAYLTYVNGYIYYANKSDSDKLYRVSASADNAQGTQLRSDKQDEKVSYIITDGANLYFNSTKAALGVVGYAAAVCKYNIASGNEVKLTSDAGKYLTIVGSYVYYVNNDKINTVLFGDGIYKVSANQTSDNHASGTKVLSIENNGYSSLTSDGTNLYYYKLNDKHFYKNSADGSNEVDLMRNFEPIEDTTLASGSYSQLAQYNGEIYYTNPLDDGALYKYNPATKAKFKVLADSVSNVSFYSYGGVNYMYYSTYIFTNYALFRMDLATGETEKVTSKRVDNLIFEGDKIYCVRVTAGNNNIIKMDLDGANEEVLYKGNNDSPDTTRLYKIDNTFYFVMNPQGGFRNVSTFTIGDKNKVNLHKAFNFVIVNNKIYYYADVTDNSTIISQKKENALKVCDIDGNNERTLVSNVDITFMYEANGKIYYSSKSSQNTGVYVYDIAKGTTTKIADKPAHGMTMLDGKLYFLQSQVSYTDDYPTQSQSCDGHLYCYDGEKVTKVA